MMKLREFKLNWLLSDWKARTTAYKIQNLHDGSSGRFIITISHHLFLVKELSLGWLNYSLPSLVVTEC